MKCVQFIKQVNNTELGKANTNETYIRVPQELDISDLFEITDHLYSFTDKHSRKVYDIRFTHGREKRIVGLGDFYRDNDLHAGDKVLVEKTVFANGQATYKLSLSKSSSVLYLQKVKDFFEVLTPERLDQFLNVDLLLSNGSVMKVLYHGEIKKRADSPSATKVYNVLLDDKNIQKNYKKDEIIGIKMQNGQVKLVGFNPWEKYITEVAE